MDREKEILSLFNELDENIMIVITPLIKETAYLEEQLNYLRTLPKIRVKKENPEIQKQTPAARLYKEYLQQYNNCIRILTSFIKMNENEEKDDFTEAINILKKKYGKL